MRKENMIRLRRSVAFFTADFIVNLFQHPFLMP